MGCLRKLDGVAKLVFWGGGVCAYVWWTKHQVCLSPVLQAHPAARRGAVGPTEHRWGVVRAGRRSHAGCLTERVWCVADRPASSCKGGKQGFLPPM